MSEQHQGPQNDRGELPSFTPSGLLPPYRGDPLGRDRSPYVVTLPSVALAFGRTRRRRELLRGLLDYRAALHAARVRGFQWVSGSIVERPSDEEPSDVDLVTFVGSRDRITDPLERKEFVESVAMAFDPEAVHARYGCHGYVVDLGTSPAQLVKQTAYWESLFAHRKTGDWRGYVSLRLVDLDEDAEARSLLGEEP